MCEAKEREVATCETLVCALEEMASTNGRCKYHEDITTGLSGVRGGFKALLWALGIIFTIIFAMQAANLGFLFKHIGNLTNVNQTQQTSKDDIDRLNHTTLQVSIGGLQNEMR